MSHRPRPDVGRARRQVLRHPGRTTCPACRHPRNAHAIENGHPVCTRGAGHVSCHYCAELQARLPVVALAAELSRAFTFPRLPNRLVLAGQPS